ncbi:MAG: hypothetical protein A2Y34_02085 [Spirochaetes bacterium GWC1_27_15]|nr:MAG: hypothetical protein A2Z98_11975 [Spirochaetes bacterium GWB1_27_13]OHD20450.1 MAG: hypothetical protein A2Y34_02085 [Spirochaetes bacterium GWC1_27_15]
MVNKTKIYKKGFLGFIASSLLLIMFISCQIDGNKQVSNESVTEKLTTVDVSVSNSTYDGVDIGQPVLVNTLSGTSHLFILGSDKALWVKYFDGYNWTAWKSLGGNWTSAPSAILMPNGTISVYVRGTDNAIWNSSYNGSVCDNWSSLEGSWTSSPAAILMSDGTISVYVRGTDNAIWVKESNRRGWGRWASLGGSFASAPAAVSMSDGTTNIYAVATDNALWTNRNNGHKWGGWSSIGGNWTSAPSVCLGTPGKPGKPVDGTWSIYVRGTDSTIWSRNITSTTVKGKTTINYEAWTNLGSESMASTPCVIYNYFRFNYDIYALGSDYMLKCKHSTSIISTGWDLSNWEDIDVVPPIVPVTLTSEEQSVVDAINNFKTALSSNNLANVLPLFAENRRSYYQNEWEDCQSNLHFLSDRMKFIMKPDVGNGYAEVYILPPKEANNEGELYVLDFEQGSDGKWYLLGY